MIIIVIAQYMVAYIFRAYLLLLIARALLSWVQVFNPYWRPQHPILLFVVKVVYLLTERPLCFIGRYVKPIQFGNVGIDLSFIILFLLVMVLQSLALKGLYLLFTQIYL